MIFASLMLTMSTCISCGCNDIAKCITMKSLEEKATTVVNSFNGLYVLDNFEMTTEDESTLIKANIMDYVGKYNLLQDEYFTQLEKMVSSESGYNDIVAYQRSLIKSDIPIKIKADYLLGLTMDYDEHGILNLGETYDVLPGIDDLIPNHPLKPTSQPQRIGKDLRFEFNNGGGGGGGTNPQDNVLPLKTYNDNNVSLELNGIVNQHTFLGLICSADACKCVYNFISEKINNYAIRPNDNKLSDWVKDFSVLVLNYKTPFALYNAIKSSGHFKKMISVINDIIKFFKTDLVGKIITILCLVVVACVVSMLIAMFVCGFFEVGFAVGWIINNIFDWDWVAQLIE